MHNEVCTIFFFSCANSHGIIIIIIGKVTVIDSIPPSRDLLAALVGTQSLDDAHLRKVHQLKNFLEKSLVLDPSKRITINQALVHPFITEKIE